MQHLHTHTHTHHCMWSWKNCTCLGVSGNGKSNAGHMAHFVPPPRWLGQEWVMIVEVTAGQIWAVQVKCWHMLITSWLCQDQKLLSRHSIDKGDGEPKILSDRTYWGHGESIPPLHHHHPKKISYNYPLVKLLAPVLNSRCLQNW